MSKYEVLTSLAALLALIISWVSLVRSRKTAEAQQRIAEEQLELQRATSDLAKKQLELILAEESTNSAASISIAIEQSGRGHKFVVSNIGDVPAHNVSFQLSPLGKGESPLVHSSFTDAFPVSVLGPGATAKALAAFHLGSATAFDVTLKWEDPDGRPRTEKTFVSL